MEKATIAQPPEPAHAYDWRGSRHICCACCRNCLRAALPARSARAKSKAPWSGWTWTSRTFDKSYDNDVHAFNGKNVLERQARNNEIALAIIGPPVRVAYGPTEIEKLDIYKCKRANAPVMVFIHGGSWRSGRSSQFAVYAEPFVKAGAHFVALDFTNVRETDGDLLPMADQCRRAAAWVYRNAASFGGNPDAVYLCSRSSGSHLASCVVITQWDKQGLPRDILKGAVFGSGMYDLKPVRLSLRSKFVKFTDEMEQQLSAIRHIERIHTPLALAVGSLEKLPSSSVRRATSRPRSRKPASPSGSSSQPAIITTKWGRQSAIRMLSSVVQPWT